MALIRSPSSFHFTNLDFRPDRKLLKSWFIKTVDLLNEIDQAHIIFWCFWKCAPELDANRKKVIELSPYGCLVRR